MAERKLQVGEGVKAGFAMVRPAWTGAPVVLALCAVVVVLYQAGLASRNPLLWAGGYLGTMLSGIPAAGAVYRLAFVRSQLEVEDSSPGPGGLQWRTMESRLLGATLVYYLAMLAAVLVLFAPAIAIVAASFGSEILNTANLTNLASKQPEIFLLAVAAALVGLIPLYWLVLRMVLIRTLAAATGEISLAKAFRLTKGHVWTILGIVIVLALPTIVIQFVGGFFRGFLLAFHAAEAGAWLNRIVVALGTAFYQLPASIGFAVYAYQKLTGARAGVAAVFE